MMLWDGELGEDAPWLEDDRRCWGSDEGRAVVEFIFLGVLLLVPLLYLVVTVAQVQAASFSAALAGREAGRAFVTAADDADAAARAEAAAALAFEDYGFGDTGRVELACDGDPCLRAGGTVTVRTSIAVELPLVPDVVSDRLPAAVTVSSTHVQAMDRFVAR